MNNTDPSITAQHPAVVAARAAFEAAARGFEVAAANPCHWKSSLAPLRRAVQAAAFDLALAEVSARIEARAAESAGPSARVAGVARDPWTGR